MLFLLAGNVIQDEASPADISMLLAYWTQLQQPLNNLGSSYKNIHNSFIDAERLLKLLMQKPSVTDNKGAKELVVKAGKIKFENVNFSYDVERTTLMGLTFCAAPGTTVALVGESGSGKSTVLRLLFRLFDIISPGFGSIDDQDIHNVTMQSLRKCIGIVPQV